MGHTGPQSDPELIREEEEFKTCLETNFKTLPWEIQDVKISLQYNQQNLVGLKVENNVDRVIGRHIKKKKKYWIFFFLDIVPCLPVNDFIYLSISNSFLKLHRHFVKHFLFLAGLPDLCRPKGPIRKGELEIYVLHKFKSRESLLFWKGIKLNFKIAQTEMKQFYSANLESISPVAAGQNDS